MARKRSARSRKQLYRKPKFTFAIMIVVIVLLLAVGLFAVEALKYFNL